MNHHPNHHASLWGLACPTHRSSRWLLRAVWRGDLFSAEHFTSGGIPALFRFEYVNNNRNAPSRTPRRVGCDVALACAAGGQGPAPDTPARAARLRGVRSGACPQHPRQGRCPLEPRRNAIALGMLGAHASFSPRAFRESLTSYFAIKHDMFTLVRCWDYMPEGSGEPAGFPGGGVGAEPPTLFLS